MSKKKQAAELAFFRALGGDSLVDDVLEYERYLQAERKKTRRKREKWQDIGRVVSYSAYESGMRFQCEHGFTDVYWVADDCVRVWARHDDVFENETSFIIDPSVHRNPVSYELIEGAGEVMMRSGNVACHIQQKPFGVSLRGYSGEYLGGEGKNTLAFGSEGGIRLSAALIEGEACYGLGERAHSLNLRGGTYALWNVDQPDCDQGTDPLYYCVPFYMGVHDEGVYGVLWDNTWRGEVDLDSDGKGQVSFVSEGGELRYYLMGGRSVQAVMARYANLTGKAPLPPLWYLGYHQCRFSYYPQEAILDLARTFREKQIPCDALYLDIHYMDAFKVGTWDSERFPDLPGMIQTLHQNGFHLLPIIDPGVKIEDGYEAYEAGLEQDVFVKTPEGEPLQAVVWAGASYMPDFTRPETVAWWQEQLRSLILTGIDGIWNDMNEPAVFVSTQADTLPDTAQYAIGSHQECHNLYGMMMSLATREALEHHRRGKRQVNITRSGYAGTHRYATSWTGDVSSDWDHLRLSIPMILNMGLSGVGLTGSDVGGFRMDTNAELLTRWTQAAALMPFFRNHTAIKTVQQEPWAFGEPYESIMRAVIELRYQLMPYLYAVVAQYAEFGVPVVRPMFMVDPSDAALRTVDDQFMLGDCLLVAPVVEQGAEQREVILPDGDWYDFYTAAHIAGGQAITVDAPLDTLPLFVRGGGVVPVWPSQQNLSGPLPTELRLRIFPGELETSLYEDDGEGLDYLNGQYRWIYLTAKWEKHRFQVHRRVAGKYEPPYKRMTLEVLGFDEEPLSVKVDRQGAPVWYYENEILELSVAEFQLLEVTRAIGPSDETVIHRPF